MKKHMEPLLKLDSAALNKRRSTLSTEIVESHRGVINGELQNTQVMRHKRRELARVNTMLSMLSKSEKTEVKK